MARTGNGTRTNDVLSLLERRQRVRREKEAAGAARGGKMGRKRQKPGARDAIPLAPRAT